MDLSGAELDVLDRVLGATAHFDAAKRLEAASLLQSSAGRSLCRKVQALRPVPLPRSVAREPVRPPSPVAGLRRDWPAGEWSVEVAAQALAAWEQSGLHEAAFCRETGISRGRIRGWKRKLRPSEAQE